MQLKTAATAGACSDLHVHSRHSDRPTEWFLRRIGAPESFIEPAAVYDACRSRGMDFVTITDHNSIRGALEIAHLPHTFVSAEVTTYFPEDGCKIHLLVLGITEQAFGEIQQLRRSIYELRDYLVRERIVYSVSHPLFRVNDRLEVGHVEKLLVLFNRFESLNGSRCPRAGRLAQAVFESLSPELIAGLADRHGLIPYGPEPWVKTLTGGSDDHSGLYSGHACTVTPPAASVSEFIQHLRDGRHQPSGQTGTSIRLAHSLYHIAYSYYRQRFLGKGSSDNTLIGETLRKMSGEKVEPSSSVWSSLGRIRPFARFIERRRKQRMSEIERLLVDELSGFLGHDSATPAASPAGEPRDEQNFRTACRIGHRMSFIFIRQFIEQVRKGSLIDSLQSVASLGPVLLGMAPYLTAFASQHKDERFLQAVSDRFTARPTRQPGGHPCVWFTDTFSEINGVANTVHTLAGLARREGRDLLVATCLPESPLVDFPLHNFEPVGIFNLPEYESQKIVLPPLLEILDFIERNGVEEIIISTPGPLGLMALAAARLFHLRVKGIYHTDFPRYVHSLTDDDQLEDLTWRYMQWFYDGMDIVFVPSRCYEKQLVARGFDATRIDILPRGVDLARFTPAHRSPVFWNRLGLNGEFKFIYVGRMSKEKNLDNMLEAFAEFLQTHRDTRMILVGDGPYLGELRTRFQRPEVIFAGRMEGNVLARAYASSDVFVFPSMTDTFGNAVLEAHACGLPAIVANCGGPQEIVGSHGSGLIVDGSSPRAIASAMATLYGDVTLRRHVSNAALQRADESRWEIAMNKLLA